MSKLIALICLLFPAMCPGQDTTRVTLLFAGDIMQHDSQIRAARVEEDHAYDYGPCFQYVKPIVEKADVAIANLELTLAGPPYKGYPQFSAPDALASGLKDAGFDVLVTANNHSLDRRSKGLERTIDVLDSLQLTHTGTFKDSASRAATYPLQFEKDSIRFSLLNYTYGTNGIPVSPPNVVNLIDTVIIRKDLALAKAQGADVIMVFMHWGSEYQDSPNSAQKKIAAFCLKHGANLIIGSHPHVLQPMEWEEEKNELVVYSLGNFVSGQQSRYRDGGAMAWVTIKKIFHTDSTSVVQLENPSFDLVWVYRNKESPKKYFILPVREFELDTLILQDSLAKNRFRTFVADARKLLNKNSKVKETMRPLAERWSYQVTLTQTPDSVTQIELNPVLEFYNVHAEPARDGRIDWVTSKFFDKEVAERALAEILASTPYTQARLVTWYWKKRLMSTPREEDTK